MKIKINKDHLYQGLQTVVGVTSKNSNDSLIQNVLLESKGKELIFSATDYEIAIQTKAIIKESFDGSCALHAAKLFSISKEFIEDDVSISTNENHWTSVFTNSSEIKFPSIEKTDN